MIFRRRTAGSRVSSGAKGYRAYAIGDVHGRLDLLEPLLARISEDHWSRGGKAKPLLVFLGDLIDRGPQSAQVLDLVSDEALPGFRTICLAGNHEEVLLRLLGGERGGLLESWLGFGGDACVQSYGMDPLQLGALGEGEALRTLRLLIPDRHADLLAGMADTFSFGDYLFVHAGIRPGISLQDQDPLDLRWIRQPFLDDERDHRMLVVHGHTISREVEERPNRIGIDTGGYVHGTLTALGIEGEERWFLQQRAPALAESGSGV